MSLVGEPMPRDADLDREAIEAEEAGCCGEPEELTDAEAAALAKAFGRLAESWRVS